MLSSFFVLTLISVICCALADYKPSDLYGDSCPALLKATQALNHAKRTFIYRCRHGDDCGGVGDRLAGAMSAAFFSAVSDRSFHIHWPGIEYVFKPGHSNWTYDPSALGIPHKDLNGNELDKTRNHATRGDGDVTNALPGHGNIVMLNDLNTREISKTAMAPGLKKYTHIYFHSNRSPDLQLNKNMVEKLLKSGVVGGTTVNDSHAGHINAYRCMFNDIFRPTEEFLDTTYKSTDGSSTSFRQLVNMVNRADERSLAFHYRIADGHVNSDHAKSRISNGTIQWIASLGIKHQVGQKKLNLFFISNSPASARRVLQDSSIRAAFGRVLSQELTGSRHINSDSVVPIKARKTTPQAASLAAPARKPPRIRSEPVPVRPQNWNVSYQLPKPVLPKADTEPLTVLPPSTPTRRVFKRQSFQQSLRQWMYMLTGRRSLKDDSAEHPCLRRLQESVSPRSEEHEVSPAGFDQTASARSEERHSGGARSESPPLPLSRSELAPNPRSTNPASLEVHGNDSYPHKMQANTWHTYEMHANSSAVLSFQQAMRDWYLMRIADVLVCGKSGFCRSAGVVASEQQIKYDGEKRILEVRTERLCTNRDCI